MTRDQLEHAIRAACDVSNDTELWIFGSQALLGEFPDATEILRASIEVDIQPKNRPETVDAIDGALGELSMFSIESAMLPDGWKQRTIPIQRPHSNPRQYRFMRRGARSCRQQACGLQGKG